MKKLKNTEDNLLKRIYYNKDGSSPKNTFYTRKFPTVKSNFNERIKELDKTLNVENIVDQLSKTYLEKDKKTILKKIIRKHYLSKEN